MGGKGLTDAVHAVLLAGKAHEQKTPFYQVLYVTEAHGCSRPLTVK